MRVIYCLDPFGHMFAALDGAIDVPRDHTYFVYILASRKYGTLYIGVTNDLLRRVGEHREGTASAFTRKCKVHGLV